MVQVVQMVSSTTNTWLGSRGGCGPSSAPHQRTRHAGIAGAHRRRCALRARRRAGIESISSCATTIAARLKTIERDGFARSKFQILEARCLRLRQPRVIPPPSSGPQRRLGEVRSAVASADRSCRRGPQGAGVFHNSSLLALLKPQLDAEHVTYEYLDGQTRDREDRARDSQEDSRCSLFLISLKAGGRRPQPHGGKCVLLDPWWNPAVEMQAIDRTHRIGGRNRCLLIGWSRATRSRSAFSNYNRTNEAAPTPSSSREAEDCAFLQREDLELLQYRLSPS